MKEKEPFQPEVEKDHSPVIEKFVKEVFGDAEIRENSSLARAINESPKSIAFLLGLMESGHLLNTRGKFLSELELAQERAKLALEGGAYGRGGVSEKWQAEHRLYEGIPILGYRPHGAPKGSEAYLMRMRGKKLSMEELLSPERPTGEIRKMKDEEGKELFTYEIYEPGKPRYYDAKGKPWGGLGAQITLESLGYDDPEVVKALDVDKIVQQLVAAVGAKMERER